MGVWLGWHACYNATQAPKGQLRENRNLSCERKGKQLPIDLNVLPVPVHKVIYQPLNTLCVHIRVKARPSDPLVIRLNSMV